MSLIKVHISFSVSFSFTSFRSFPQKRKKEKKEREKKLKVLQKTVDKEMKAKAKAAKKAEKAKKDPKKKQKKSNQQAEEEFGGFGELPDSMPKSTSATSMPVQKVSSSSNGYMQVQTVASGKRRGSVDPNAPYLQVGPSSKKSSSSSEVTYILTIISFCSRIGARACTCFRF